MFYDHNGFKLEINNRKVFEDFSNILKQINTLLNNSNVKEKIKSTLNWIKMKTQYIKICEMPLKEY